MPEPRATRPPSPDAAGIRLRLDLAYDGTGFAGWARQPALRTVQGVVEDALARALRLDSPSITVAGRTDAGVHAVGQVAHVDVPVDRAAEPERLAARLRGLLPDDVTCHAVRIAPPGFDARFSALSRHYRYVVCDDPRSWDPGLRHRVVALRPLGGGTLDIAAMNQAAEALLGEHDFAALCRPRPGATTIRRLLHAEWTRGDGADGAGGAGDADGAGFVHLRVGADAFCHSMVRSLVGLLLPVGRSRRPPGWPATVVAAGRRDPAVTVMPAHGLVLEEVRYPPVAEMGERARQTRVLRTRVDPLSEGPVA